MNDKKVDLSVTFLPVMNDIVNDKKGHNFMNDKTYWEFLVGLEEILGK